MLRKLLSMAVLLGFILPTQPSTIPTTNPNTEYKLYLPLSIYTFPSVEVFATGYPDWGGHSYEYCVYGYIIALTPSAVYSVTLAIDMMNLSDNTYAHTDYRPPILKATLPDQKNPFAHCIHCYVPSCEYKPGEVKLASARLNPPSGRVIYPLTVTGWRKKVTESGTSILGAVRNDSGYRLVDIHVVGILSPGIEDFSGLYWYEAILESTTLDPGEKTDFRFDHGGEYVSEISAQGVAEP